MVCLYIFRKYACTFQKRHGLGSQVDGNLKPDSTTFIKDSYLLPLSILSSNHFPPGTPPLPPASTAATSPIGFPSSRRTHALGTLTALSNPTLPASALSPAGKPAPSLAPRSTCPPRSSTATGMSSPSTGGARDTHLRNALRCHTVQRQKPQGNVPKHAHQVAGVCREANSAYRPCRGALGEGSDKKAGLSAQHGRDQGA
ncbi:hypothetical protein Fmac_019102 [Flemingia macrophylla]|uniref:Uncharacterized protein n=1 Tax=Flemingia macrophylla TaxID=520843 RepID=A0ABD1M6W1_9FABA